MSSKVWFMNDRAQSFETSMVAKMLTVFDAAGFAEMISPGDVVAIKVHCGEYNNTAYLRPVYARALADRIKEVGGRPFVCDTTTLPYLPVASRCTALDELLTAERNGYNSATLGCPFIVADGFMGTDDIRVDVPEGFICKEAYVAKALALADVLITLSHFKGHPFGVIGGTIKNLGIGCQSKRGKFNIHMGGHTRYSMINSPVFLHKCLGQDCPTYAICTQVCPYDLFKFKEVDGKFILDWDQQKCTNCLACLGVVMLCGVVGMPEDTQEALNAAMADGALGMVNAVGREKCGFINLAIDVTPSCDCVPWADRPIVPNVGVFASKDPVAIDMATLDKTEELIGMPGSACEERGVAAPGTKGRFAASSSMMGISEMIQINTGEKIGLGVKDYELIEVPPAPAAQFIFHWDKRMVSDRLRRMHAKDPVFPFDKGFNNRLQEVDFTEVR